jgi:hypothetical protein
MSEPTEKHDDKDDKDETLRERFMRLVAGDPRFKEAEKSGKAFVIAGHLPAKKSL